MKPNKNKKLTAAVLTLSAALVGAAIFTVAHPEDYKYSETSAVLDQTDAQPQNLEAEPQAADYETMTEGEPMAYLPEAEEAMEEEAYTKPEKTLKDEFPVYRKENAEIESDIQAYYDAKQEVRELKAELKAHRKADRKAECIDTKAELKQAKADKKMFKAYFKADKAELKAERQLAIDKTHDEVCEDRKALRQAKKQVRKDLRKGNHEALVGHAKAVKEAGTELDESTAQLNNQKGSYEANFVAIGRDVDEAQEEYVALGKTTEEPIGDESSAMADGK